MTGMVCVAMAGLALLMTNVQLGALFGRGQTTFVGLLSGCYDVSAIMQLLIKVSDVSYCIVLYCIETLATDRSACGDWLSTSLLILMRKSFWW